MAQEREIADQIAAAIWHEWRHGEGSMEYARILIEQALREKTRTKEELAHLLAKEAKTLTYGMQDRVKRNPDVADYLACFAKAMMEQ